MSTFFTNLRELYCGFVLIPLILFTLCIVFCSLSLSIATLLQKHREERTKRNCKETEVKNGRELYYEIHNRVVIYNYKEKQYGN